MDGWMDGWMDRWIVFPLCVDTLHVHAMFMEPKRDVRYAGTGVENDCKSLCRYW